MTTERDRINQMEYAREKGLAEGKASGLAEGLSKGRASGLADGRAEVARKLAELGIDAEIIRLATGAAPLPDNLR